MMICVCSTARAQHYSGSWKVYSAFDEVSAIADTPDKVYYVSTGQLYSYDKASEETSNFTGSLLLSSPNITDIGYDSASKKLIVVYDNADIDVIDSKGRVDNLPDIKDAQLSVVPAINDFTVDGGKLYVATNFGIVVFDLKKNEVITSGDYGKDMVSIEVWGDYLIVTDGDAANYYVGKDEKLTSFSKLTLSYGMAFPDYLALSDEVILANLNLSDSNRLLIYKKNAADEPLMTKMSCIYEKDFVPGSELIKAADGSAFYYTPTELLHIGNDGRVVSIAISGTDLEKKKKQLGYQSKHISALSGLDELWLGSSDGVASYQIDGTNKVSTLSSAVKPQNALTFSNIGRLYTSPSGKVYVGNWGATLLRKQFSNQDDNLFNINVIEDGEISDVTPLEFTVDNPNNKSFSTYPTGFKSGADFREDPSDPDAYYIGSAWDGVYHIKDRKQIHKYYDTNSSMETVSDGYALRAYGLDIDKEGNLWVGTFVFNGQNILHMLPNDKRSKQNTVPADWSALDQCARNSSSYDTRILACRNSNCVFYIDATHDGAIHVVKTKGTTSTSDDNVYQVTEFIDQDGKKFTNDYFYFIVEDKQGAVWVGTENGVFAITNPDDISCTSIKINHLIVPRKDGSNFADYLLDGETIYWIAVD
ncbi:MAG: hypothetical protein K2J06_07420, partial [Muribaculaceae bacterium]|nr:hypothetical protein [Muribaculaceae bacterium]